MRTKMMPRTEADLRARIIESAIMLALAVLLLAAAASAADAAPVTPDVNAPPASWQAVSEAPQYASLPGVETNRLIQGAGREWRSVRNGPITQYGGWVFAAVLTGIAVFFAVKGRIKLKHAPSGRLIERFNAFERLAHWSMALSFIVLALTGVLILWGKYLVLPWLGYTGFSSLMGAAKAAHNFVGPLFAISLVASFLIFVKDNLLERMDFTWIARLGGMFGAQEVPSGRFNGLEKAWFWLGLALLGGIVAASGLILDFPNWSQGRETMQQANMVHAIAAVLFTAASFGHIYIGTLGMEGAYQAMRRGHVDEEWARQHHVLWYREVKGGVRDEAAIPEEAAPSRS